MLLNLEIQLKGMNMLQRLPEVLDEVARVRTDMDYPPLATPSSQMYGMPSGKISDELMQKAIGDETPDFKRPGELLAPEIEPGWQGCAGLARVWEDVFSNEASIFILKSIGQKNTITGVCLYFERKRLALKLG